MNADRASRPPIVATKDDEALGRPVSKPAEPPSVRDPVDEANEASFPASDPPAWWAGP